MKQCDYSIQKKGWSFQIIFALLYYHLTCCNHIHINMLLDSYTRLKKSMCFIFGLSRQIVVTIISKCSISNYFELHMREGKNW